MMKGRTNVDDVKNQEEIDERGELIGMNVVGKGMMKEYQGEVKERKKIEKIEPGKVEEGSNNRRQSLRR